MKGIHFFGAFLLGTHFLIFLGGEEMRAIKINERGQITIPKSIRNKYGLKKGVEFKVTEYDEILKIEIAKLCSKCGKAILHKYCPDCPRPKQTFIY